MDARDDVAGGRGGSRAAWRHRGHRRLACRRRARARATDRARWRADAGERRRGHPVCASVRRRRVVGRRAGAGSQGLRQSGAVPRERARGVRQAMKAAVTTDRPVFGRRDPDARGYFGAYGGRFVPETLVAPIEELTAGYLAARADTSFRAELDALLR